MVLSPRPLELAGPPFAAQSLSRIDPKIHQNFNRFLIPFWKFWLPKWLPKPSKIIQKSFQNQVWSEKRDFLKNSTALKRDTHFWGSSVPKTLPKSTKNRPGTDQKSNQNFDRILNRFFNDFSSILVPKMTPKSFQKWSKKRTEKYIEKSSKNDAQIVSKMEVPLWPGCLLFKLFFCSGFSEVPRAHQGA